MTQYCLTRLATFSCSSREVYLHSSSVLCNVTTYKGETLGFVLFEIILLYFGSNFEDFGEKKVMEGWRKVKKLHWWLLVNLHICFWIYRIHIRTWESCCFHKNLKNRRFAIHAQPLRNKLTGLDTQLLKNILENTSPFCGATGILVLDLVVPVFKVRVDPSPVCNGFLRFTSGAAPADLLSDVSQSIGEVRTCYPRSTLYLPSWTRQLVAIFRSTDDVSLVKQN